MINGLEGIPGSGKSYEAVVYHVLPALEEGRKVITNLPLLVEMFSAVNPDYRKLIEVRRRVQPVRGTWDANRVDDQGNGNAFDLFEDGHTEPAAATVMLFGHVWDYFSVWKHPKTGQGPLFIIDECHVSMPSRGTDAHVIEWFKLHRHFNADVLLATQSFRDMDQSIARLLAVLTKVRKADVLGKADHYIRKAHAGYRGGLVSQEERKYKPEYFAYYKSHTQGNSVGEAKARDMTPFIVKWKRGSRAFMAFALIACVWAFWPSSDKPKASAKVQTKPPIVNGQPIDMTPVAPIDWSKVPTVPDQPDAQPSLETDTPEPLAGKGVHLAGVMTMGAKTVYTFVLSLSGQRIGDASDSDLRTMGYDWKPLTHCAGMMTWKGKPRAITCDAPILASGGQDRPVVLAVGPGSNVQATSARGGMDYQPGTTPPSTTPTDVTAAYRK